MALFTPEVTWHEYSNGIGSEFFASPPDASEIVRLVFQFALLYR